jgi:biopolymer transport protein ExbD
MAVRIRCPRCETVLTVSEDLVGGRVHCRSCAATLEVPRPVAGTQEDAAEDKVEVAQEIPVRFRGSPERTRDEMDMTPMVDVTFLLLIFFMVTAAFQMQKSFEVPAPDESLASTEPRTLKEIEDDPQFVVVRIDSYNTYRVITADWDREAPSEQELLVKLREARQPGSHGVIPTRLLVAAHGDARHEKVVTALDAGTEVGMEEVQLVTVEEDV